jgi:hypothetical protein
MVEGHEFAKKEQQTNFVSEVFIRFRIGVIVLIGSGESLISGINVIAINIIGIFSDEMHERGELEACFFKGVVVSVLISVYALAGTERALALIVRIEEEADAQFHEISSQGLARFEEFLEKVRRTKVEEYLANGNNPVELFPGVWDHQTAKAKKAFAHFTQHLNKIYPMQLSDGKYAVLREARKTIQFILDASSQFVLVKEDVEQPLFTPFDFI